MQNNLASEASKPPPIPASIADHARPASTQQATAPVATHWVNFHLIVPDLPIAQWASRLFKFGLGLVLASLALALPMLAVVGIWVAIAAALK